MSSNNNGQQGSSSGQEPAPLRPPAPTRRPSSFNKGKNTTSRKGRTQGMAHYKPLTSYVRSGPITTRPPTVASRREPPTSANDPTLGTIEENEADIMSVMTELTGNLPVARYKFEAPQDPEAARIMQIITEYLEETQVESKVLGICQSLLAKPDLPYNPYPEMISRLRCFAERFHMLRKDMKSLKALLENTTIPTSIPFIFGVESCDNVWGLKEMVRIINPTVLKAYDWLLSNHMPQKVDFEDNQHDFNGQVLIALIAPCIFQGTFHKDVASFTVRLHYILYGSNPSMSTRIIVDQIVKQVNILTSPDSPHVLLKAVTVPAPNSGVSEWSFQLIDDRQEKFRTALLETVTSKAVVTLEGIFLMDPNKKHYKQGKMEFNFHFVESTNNGRERLKSYEALPYKTLFEGVFWKKVHAEAYYSLFNNPEMESTSQASVGKSGKSSVKKKPERVGATTAKTPVITADIKETFKQKQQQIIASLYEAPDAYEISQYVILVSLIDSGKLNSDILVELCQLHQSTSAQLLTCIQHNDTIQDIINSAPGLSNEHHVLLKIIERLFEDYQKKLLPLLDTSLFARSSDVQTSHKFISMATNKCKQLLADEKFLPKPFLKSLVKMNSHCTVLFYQLTEDALALCPKLKEVFDQCREIFPDLVPRPQTRVAQNRQDLSKKKSKKFLYVAEETLTHGTEISDLTQQDNMVIKVEEVIESSNRPKIMAIEGALMQYLIDTKLDEVWNVFLNGLLLFSDHLPPNPYPKLVTLFRQAALRMRFNGDNDEKVVKRVLHQKAKVHNQKHFIYTIASSKLFGHLSALCVLDTATFSKVWPIAKLFARKEYLQRKGQLQISLSLAVTNMTSLYGIVMPYLNIMYLSEFCYIRGPIGNHYESILLYTKMILDDVQHIGSHRKVIVTGVHVSQTKFTLEDIIKNPDFFHTKLSSAIENKEVIFLQIYKALGWRFMSIRKQYCLFYVYVDGTIDRQEVYFPQKPQSLYCNLFLSADEACNHFAQVSSGSNLSNPLTRSKIQRVSASLNQQILQGLSDNKIMKAYKLLVIKSLINQQTNCLADIWRMFHCEGPALEYLRHVNSAMQGLVKHALSVMQDRVAKTAGVINKEELGFDDMSLGKMMKAYQQKLESVLDNSCSFAPQCLWPIIKRKLQLITERSQVSKELALCITEQTIQGLEEVNKLLEPLQAWIVEDMHNTCSNVQHEFKVIQIAGQGSG